MSALNQIYNVTGRPCSEKGISPMLLLLKPATSYADLVSSGSNGLENQVSPLTVGTDPIIVGRLETIHLGGGAESS